jgi:hypothetical protein
MGICIFGQGDCQTHTSTDISDITNNDTNINNSIKNLINQNCNTDTLQSNTINIIGSNVKKLSATQKNSIESMCILQTVLKSNVSSSVIDNLLNKLKNNVETSGALLGSPASNDTIVKKLTSNKSTVDNSKFNQVSKNCILGAKQSNLLNIIGSNVEDTTTDQANTAFLKCLSQHSDDTGITASDLSDTKNETDNTTKTQGGDIAKSAGEAISTAAQGIGKGIGSAAEGLGEGIGAGLGGQFIIPCIILLVISAIVGFIMFSKH